MSREHFRIQGRVRHAADDRPGAGLRVEAWDLDFLSDDRLGSAVTDAEGNFVIEFHRRRFRDYLVDRFPDVFFKIFDGSTLLENGEERVVWDVAAGEREVELEIGREQLERPEPVSRVDLAREQTDRLLDDVLPTLDRALLLVPPDRLHFRPVPEARSAAEVVCHAYQVVHACYRAVELGRLSRADLADLPCAAGPGLPPADLLGWGERVREHARAVAAGLTEGKLRRTIRHYTGRTATGWESLRTAHESALHHRGELLTYLRLLGVEPPAV